MAGTGFDLELRPASLEDAPLVADLDTARNPDDPHDPIAMRHWWALNDLHEITVRRVAVDGGEAVAFVAAWHQPWETTEARFGNLRAALRPNVFSEERFEGLVRIGEEWLASQGVATAVTRAGEKFRNELGVLGRIGYREDRRQRISELDLVERREHVLETLETTRRLMAEQGVTISTLRADSDPHKLQKLYEMMVEAERDIPTTAPWRVLPFEDWKHFWFDHPGIRDDRFWIARRGDDIVAMSSLDFPITRGFPYTALTATARSVRGRGIARALKYETMNQAMELGFTRVRTNNDADNAPILRINGEMGYRLVSPVIEMHKGLLPVS